MPVSSSSGPRPKAGVVLTVALTLVMLVLAFAAQARAADLEKRRQQVESLPPSEQQELLRKQEQFALLPRAEQDRLRALQAAVDTDPNAERLQHVLSRYHEWLKTLTPTQRAELADLSPEERVKQIKRLQHQQQVAREHSHRAELLTRHDSAEILRWTEDGVWDNRDRILAKMPKDQRKKLEKTEPKWQRRVLLYKAFESARQGGGSSLSTVTQEEIDKLAAKLSEPAQKELHAAGDLAAQRRVVGGWIAMAMHRGGESWQHGRKFGPLVGEDLMQFLENEVSAPQRERLLKLPREQMLDELRGMYFARAREFGVPSDGPPWADGKSFDRNKSRGPGKGGRPPGRPGPPDGRPPQGRGPDSRSRGDAEKPAADKPADDKPAENKPAADKPASLEPPAEKPAAAEAPAASQAPAP